MNAPFNSPAAARGRRFTRLETARANAEASALTADSDIERVFWQLMAGHFAAAIRDFCDGERPAVDRPRRVIIESPYAGNIERNVAYARAAVRDSVLRGEAPIASHLLFTQPGILDDDKPDERAQGIAAGLAWGPAADATAVYTDIGTSRGMWQGISRAQAEGRPVEFRSIEGWETEH